MNILIDELPEYVAIDDVEYKINTDYRISIMFEMMIQDNTLTRREKPLIALSLYYPEIPHNTSKALQKIMWFYSCGKTKSKVTKQKTSKKEKSNASKQIYSFEYDAELIFAAYLGQYGVNLQRIDHLHWWEFKALFEGLNASNKIIEVMSIRNTEITKDMPKAEKERIRRLKEVYKLPDMRTEEEKIRETQQTFNLFGG